MGTCSGKITRQCVGLVLRKIFRTKYSKLISAIREGNFSMVKQYQAQNVNFNQVLPNGDTLLHVAAKYGNFEIVKFVANNTHVLKVNDRNYLGDTPLIIAVMNHKYEKDDHNESVKPGSHNQRASKVEKVDRNVKKDSFAIIEYLIKVKAVNVNIAENRGFTPFLAACANGDHQLVNYLIENGANFKVRSRDGQTGMHRAAFHGNEEVIIYLIRQIKMNTLTVDNQGNLPIHYACMKLNISCIRILIKAGNIPAVELLNTENKHGVKPIDILLRVLNRVRIYNDPYTQFKKNEIEEYIANKHRLPPFHKNPDLSSIPPGSPISPRSSRASRSRRNSNNASIRLSERRAAPLLRLSMASNAPPAGYDQLLQTLDSESRLPTEENSRPMITEEEELMSSTSAVRLLDSLSTRRRGTSARLSRPMPLPVIPSELSPRHKHTTSLSPQISREKKPKLKVETKPFEAAKSRLSLRSHSYSRVSFSLSAEEPKSAHSFLLARGAGGAGGAGGKSRFATSKIEPDSGEARRVGKKSASSSRILEKSIGAIPSRILEKSFGGAGGGSSRNLDS